MEEVKVNSRKIEYEIIRKNVKNINLRVKPDGSVIVSANSFVPNNVIEDFIVANSKKILMAIDKMAVENSDLSFNSGSRINLLGKSFNLVIEKSNEDSYFVDDSQIFFYLKNPNDKDMKQSMYDLLLKNTAKVVFPKIVEEIFPNFQAVCAGIPEIKIKNLKSQWGNCYHKRNLITLNSSLSAYEMNVIRFVVCHEFCHFVYQNHSKAFYNLLTTVMPDWKKYDKILKRHSK